MIDDDKAYARLAQLEVCKDFDDRDQFKDFLADLLKLIENSNAFESASTLLWRKIFQEKIFQHDLANQDYRNLVFSVIKENAVEPYVRLTASISRLITTIIYDTTQTQSISITNITSQQYLLEINQFFLQKYAENHNLDEYTMSLLYHCIADIDLESYRITLSPEACRLVRDQIAHGGLDNYLHMFIRPFYSSMSSYWEPDAWYHVPEPFYRQIFETDDFFDSMLSNHRKDIKEKELIDETLRFMSDYRKQRARNLEYVYIKPLKLHKKYHKYLREVE